MSRRIYVATNFAGAPLAQALGRALEMRGHTITSRWHKERITPEEARLIESDRALRQAVCLRNWKDLRDANTVLLIANSACRGALCEAEHGYHFGHETLIVGDPFALTLMLDLPNVRWFDRTDAAVAYLDRAQPRCA